MPSILLLSWSLPPYPPFVSLFCCPSQLRDMDWSPFDPSCSDYPHQQSFADPCAMNCDEEIDEQKGLTALGSDQLLAILQLLPVQAIIALGMTCRRFKKICNMDELWAIICRREWGNKSVDGWRKIRRKVGWKLLYQEMLRLSSASWTQIQPGDVVPAARASHSLNLVAGKVAIFGGGSVGGRDLDDTWVGTLEENCMHWQQGSTGTPPGRFGHSCIAVEDTLVLFGGINDQGIRQSDTWLCKCVFGQELSWQLLEVAIAPPARGAHAGCYAGGKNVVIFGGIGSNGVRLQDTWILDLSAVPLCWYEVTPAVSPPARSGHTLTWIGGHRSILFGGRGVKFEVLNDVWLLDLGQDIPSWVELQHPDVYSENDLPSPRAGHSASLIFGGRVLVFGGEDARRSRKGDLWLLDPFAVWSPSYMSGKSCKALNIHGKRGIHRFWKKLKIRGRSPSKRSFHGACTLDTGHAVLIFGGMVEKDRLGLEFDAGLYLLQLMP